MVGLEERRGPRRPIPHTGNSILQASRPRCSGGHVHAPDNCLKRIGGDILEMSCAGIISIPLVLACMQSVRGMERAEQGEEEEGHLLDSSYSRFHRQGTIGPVIISASRLKSEGGEQQWPTSGGNDNLGPADAGGSGEQRVKGGRCRATWKH